MRALFHALLLLLPAAGFAAESAWLSVSATDRKLTFTAEEFAALPRTELTAPEPHAKIEHRYTGVAVREFLARLKVPTGKSIRGAAQQLAVLVRGTDGYTVVFSLAELDEGFGNRAALLADREDGVPLNERYGPLRLIVPGDQFAARWVRNVASLELVTVGPVIPRAAKPQSP